jgi:hypothetical protein
MLFLSSWFSAQSATQLADDLEFQLRYNRDQYIGGPHTADRQRAALAYFDQQYLRILVRNPFGTATAEPVLNHGVVGSIRTSPEAMFTCSTA